MMHRDLHTLLGRLYIDPDLDKTACLTLMLASAVEVVIRFNHYRSYPYKLAQLCGDFNADFRLACVDFLRVPEAELDDGFGLQLKKEAMKLGSEASALIFC